MYPLREWRERRGWSLRELAGLTGYSAGYLSRIERRQRDPSPTVKVHVARSLGAPVADLFPVEEVPAA